MPGGCLCHRRAADKEPSTSSSDTWPRGSGPAHRCCRWMGAGGCRRCNAAHWRQSPAPVDCWGASIDFACDKSGGGGLADGRKERCGLAGEAAVCSAGTREFWGGLCLCRKCIGDAMEVRVVQVLCWAARARYVCNSITEGQLWGTVLDFTALPCILGPGACLHGLHS